MSDDHAPYRRHAAPNMDGGDDIIETALRRLGFDDQRVRILTPGLEKIAADLASGRLNKPLDQALSVLQIPEAKRFHIAAAINMRVMELNDLEASREAAGSGSPVAGR